MAKGQPVDREKIYKKIAREEGLATSEVKEIIRHQFKFVKKVMARGNYNSVRLPKFGIFNVKESRLKNIKEHYNGKR